MSDSGEAVTKSTEGQGFNAQGDDSLEQHAYTSLVRTASRLEAELNRLFRPFDLTSATFNILRVLDGAGGEGRSCGDIAQQLIAEVPDMTRLLDRLERLEYVVRERSRIDRRMVKVMITDKGQQVVAALRSPVREFHKRALRHLDDERLKGLVEVLRHVRVGDDAEVTSEGLSVDGSAIDSATTV